MPTCCSHLKCTFNILLSLNISKVEVKLALLLIEDGTSVNFLGLVFVAAIKESDNIRKAVHTVNIEIIYHSSLAHVLVWHNKSAEMFLARSNGNRQGTAYWSQ